MVWRTNMQLREFGKFKELPSHIDNVKFRSFINNCWHNRYSLYDDNYLLNEDEDKRISHEDKITIQTLDSAVVSESIYLILEGILHLAQVKDIKSSLYDVKIETCDRIIHEYIIRNNNLTQIISTDGKDSNILKNCCSIFTNKVSLIEYYPKYFTKIWRIENLTTEKMLHSFNIILKRLRVAYSDRYVLLVEAPILLWVDLHEHCEFLLAVRRNCNCNIRHRDEFVYINNAFLSCYLHSNSLFMSY